MNNNDIEQIAAEYAEQYASNIEEYWDIIEQGLIWGVNTKTGAPNTTNDNEQYVSEIDKLISNNR